MKHKFHDAKGAGMIELLIAVAIIATSFFAIAQISIMALRAAGDRNDKAQALALAEEGVEAVRRSIWREMDAYVIQSRRSAK